MTPEERAGFLAHSRLSVFKNRVEHTRRIIQEALDIGPAYVACSWGKDSIVMLHLVQSVQPDIPAVFFADPEEEMLDNYAEVSTQYCSLFPTNYRRISLDGDRVPEKVTLAALWQTLPVAFVGVRAQESSGRRMAFRQQGTLHRYQSGARAGSWRCWPLAHWSWQQVWAYAVLHRLPMLASYEHAANADRAHSRTCNLVAKKIAFGPKGAEMGRIAILRARNPEYYSYLCQFYPEIARLA